MELVNSSGERRQSPRFPVQLPLDYWEVPGVVRGGIVADMSSVGLRIHSVHPIQIGAKLRIRVYVLIEAFTFGSIEGSGRIIWSTLHREGGWKGYRCGLYLAEMALDDRKRLIHFLKPLRLDQQNPLNNSYP